ncbi:hypothetical protein FRC11_008545 [Ceratobasidium sp. 423]|nr:hypothetical protein FRC11_008545 [Ceratobasidium sp. 423]
MAVGFGKRMGSSPMVVIWANRDGSLVLSQVFSDSSWQSSGQTSENMIYAFSKEKPNSNSVSATLTKHSTTGSFTLDLTGNVPDPSPSSTSSALPTQAGGSGNGPLTIPYSTAEKKLLAHGILSALGFCFFLPISIIGLVLLLLYVFQAMYGLIIHKIKNPHHHRCPIQNYGHAILGLAVITLSLYQVWLGFNAKWPSATGRNKPAQGWSTFWVVWVAVLGGAYIIGLALVPKQYKAERDAIQAGGKNMSSSDIDVHLPSTHA